MGEHTETFAPLAERLAPIEAGLRQAVDTGADDATVAGWLEELAAAEATLADTDWTGLTDLRGLLEDLRSVHASPVPFDGLVARGYAGRFASWLRALREQLLGEAPAGPAAAPDAEREALLASIEALHTSFRAAQDEPTPGAQLTQAIAQLETLAAAAAAADGEELARPVRDIASDLAVIAKSPVAFGGIVAVSITDRFAPLVPDLAALLSAGPSAPGAGPPGDDALDGPATVDILEQSQVVAAFLEDAVGDAPPAAALLAIVDEVFSLSSAATVMQHEDLGDALAELAQDLIEVADSPVPFDGLVAQSTVERFTPLLDGLLRVQGGALPTDDLCPRPADEAVGRASVAAMMLEEGDDAGALAPVLDTVEALYDELRHDAPADVAGLVLSVKAHLSTRMFSDEMITDAEIGALQAAFRTVQESLRAVAAGKSVVLDIPAQVEALIGLSDATPAVASPAEVGDPSGVPTLVRLVQETDNPRILEVFIEDVKQQVETLEGATLNWEANPTDEELLRAIFRSVHTIKGDAGLIGYQLLNQVFHSLENILCQLREGEVPFRPVYAQLVLENTDLIGQVIADLETALALESLDGWTPQVTDAVLNKMLHTITQATAGQDADTAPPAAAAPEPAPAGTTPADDPERPLGEFLLESKAINRDQLEGALQKQEAVRRVAGVRETLKVNLERLDTLIDLVGELSIAESMLVNQRRALGAVNGDATEFDKLLDRFGKLTGDIQDRALAMRMVPVKRAFQKMQRLVRDLAQRAGKDVTLQTIGEDTEIDKTLVEELGDPLSHLIRNALDHGLESPAERQAAGKPAMGQVRLEAYHAAGNIVLEMADDGRGIDTAKVLARAESRGLVEPGAHLPDQQIYQFLFMPGFSLAAEVTEISGRGVGLDVVKKNMEKLRGRVEVVSAPGKGTTFRLKLPLTLAIIDGMVAEVGSERYIIPLLNIVQSVRPEPGQVQTVQGRGEFVRARGQLLPLVRLHELYDVEPRTQAPWEALVVIVVHDDDYAGLLVDDLLGQHQVVVKSLGAAFGHLPGISGASIMGDGRVGLILDIPTLLEHARTSDRRTVALAEAG